MQIAIISARGIPNHYGGFEQFAELLSVGLVERGHAVTVYSPHYHPYQKDSYRGVRVKHIYSPETWLGAAFGSFFYDFSSLKDALRKERFDILYIVGYTSIVPALIWFNTRRINHPVFVLNMDGLEYQRDKFNKITRKFIEWEERIAVSYTRHLIADNRGIQAYIRDKYGRESVYLSYGASIHKNYDLLHLNRYQLLPNDYYLIIARLELENNVEMAIEAYLDSDQREKRPLIIVGSPTTSYGQHLQQKYGNEKSIRMIGGIYDFHELDSLRHFSRAYFHGHSVGGTNPSLLEAMASGCFIFAHDNPFNRAVLKGNSLYYGSKEELTAYLNRINELLSCNKATYLNNNLNEIRTHYSWEQLLVDYEKYFFRLLENYN